MTDAPQRGVAIEDLQRTVRESACGFGGLSQLHTDLMADDFVRRVANVLRGRSAPALESQAVAEVAAMVYARGGLRGELPPFEKDRLS